MEKKNYLTRMAPPEALPQIQYMKQLRSWKRPFPLRISTFAVSREVCSMMRTAGTTKENGSRRAAVLPFVLTDIIYDHHI